jgi:hypothetical protein
MPWGQSMVRYLTDNETIAEFQNRRRQTWSIIRPWTFVTVGGFVLYAVAFTFAERLDDRLMTLFLGTFLVLFVSIGRISFTVTRLYRCPACDTVPKDRGKVLIDPTDCTICGARLK